MPFTEVFTILFFGCLVLLVNLRFINLIGVISASIFVIHPFVRMILYKAFENNGLSLTPMVIIYLITVALFSIIHYWFYKSFLPREAAP